MDEHTLLHEPQCWTSLPRSTQPCPHAESPASQATPHDAALQVATPPLGSGHAVEQSPQWLGSEARLTQAPAQSVSEPQDEEQTPFRQASPAAQALSQAPQKAGLEPRSTQLPKHSLRPASHAMPHLASAQLGLPRAGALQTWSQPPQCAGLF